MLNQLGVWAILRLAQVQLHIWQIVHCLHSHFKATRPASKQPRFHLPEKLVVGTFSGAVRSDGGATKSIALSKGPAGLALSNGPASLALARGSGLLLFRDSVSDTFQESRKKLANKLKHFCKGDKNCSNPLSLSEKDSS